MAKKRKKKNRMMAPLRLVGGQNFSEGIGSTARRVANAVDLGLINSGRAPRLNRRINSAIGAAIANRAIGSKKIRRSLSIVPSDLLAMIAGGFNPGRMFGRRMFGRRMFRMF